MSNLKWYENMRGDVKMIIARMKIPSKKVDIYISTPESKMTEEKWTKVLEVAKWRKYAEIDKHTAWILENGQFAFTCTDAETRYFASKKENQGNLDSIMVRMQRGILSIARGEVWFEHEKYKGAMYQFTTEEEFNNWVGAGTQFTNGVYAGGKAKCAEVGMIGATVPEDQSAKDFIETVDTFVDDRIETYRAENKLLGTL